MNRFSSMFYSKFTETNFRIWMKSAIGIAIVHTSKFQFSVFSESSTLNLFQCIARIVYHLVLGLSSFYFMNWIESARCTHSHMTLIYEHYDPSVSHMLRTRMSERDERIAHFMLTGTVLSSIFDSSLFLLLQSLFVSYFIYWGILLHTILRDRQCECGSNKIVKNKANTISPQREQVSE